MGNEINFNGGNTDEIEMWSSQFQWQFKQLQVLARKKSFQGFNGIRTMASALALQCSTNWAMKTHMLGADAFMQFIFTRWDTALNIKGELDKIWSAPNIWVYIAQLVEHCRANTGAMGWNPVEALKVLFGLKIAIT